MTSYSPPTDYDIWEEENSGRSLVTVSRTSRTFAALLDYIDKWFHNSFDGIVSWSARGRSMISGNAITSERVSLSL